MKFSFDCRRFSLLALSLHLCIISAFCTTFHTGPVICGAGSWINFPPDGNTYNAYNKLSFDSYFSFKKLKGFIGFPILNTLSKRDSLNVNGKKVPYDTTFSAVAPGDLSAYIGFRAGNFEPRIGIIIPLGYATNSGVWLGSKNIILRTGTGFSGDINKEFKLRFGGEIYFNYYIAGFPEIEGSMGKSGSWSLEPDLKITLKPVKKWTIGMETLCGFKKLYPVWLKYGSFQGYELSSSIVTHFIASYDLASRFYLSGKAGFGPGFKSKFNSAQGDHPWEHTGYALNLGVSVGFYP